MDAYNHFYIEDCFRSFGNCVKTVQLNNCY